jgi:hypothetical protein
VAVLSFMFGAESMVGTKNKGWAHIRLRRKGARKDEGMGAHEGERNGRT